MPQINTERDVARRSIVPKASLKGFGDLHLDPKKEMRTRFACENKEAAA